MTCVARGLPGEHRKHGAKRVEPRVQLDAARVRFLYGIGQRIVRRTRRLARLSGEKCRPRRVLRRIHRVAGEPDMEDQRVESDRRHVVEHRAQLGALRVRRQAGGRRPIAKPAIPDWRRPRRAKLARHRRRSFEYSRRRNVHAERHREQRDRFPRHQPHERMLTLRWLPRPRRHV